MPSIKAGSFVVGLPEANANYSKTKAGFLGYVQNFVSPHPMREKGDTVIVGLSNAHQKIKTYCVEKKHFRVATSEEIDKRLIKAARDKKYAGQPVFKPGSVIETKRDFSVKRRMFFFDIEVPINKGRIGVIDANPMFGNKDLQPEEMALGEYQFADFCTPNLKVFFPEENTLEEHCPASYFKEKIFDDEVEKRIILPPGYYDRIMRTISRVLNRKTHESVYSELDLNNICQKGKGSIILLYGPPGTGKTMTAEVITEKIRRPLLRVNISSFRGNLDSSLEDAFEKAKKYNCILLLDEVDVFIKKRGDHFVMDENTSIFLRMMEYFDGILFMTTNLVGAIDEAVFSRVHVSLSYELASAEERYKLWKNMIKGKLLESIVGNDEQIETMFKELSSYSINGREIKNIIQNVVTRAVVAMGKMKLPESKWINRSFFLEEVGELVEQRESLKSDKNRR